MAKTNSYGLPEFTGKLGGVVHSKWNTINTARAYQPNVSNPKTVLQTNQRKRLSLLVALARKILTVIRYSFNELAVKKSSYNVFIQKNIQNVSEESQPLEFNDMRLVAFSAGTLTPPTFTARPTAAAGNVNFTLETANPNDNPSDELIIVAYDSVTGEAVIAETGIKRSQSGTLKSVTMTNSNASIVDVYFFFTNTSRSKNSNNVSEFALNIG